MSDQNPIDEHLERPVQAGMDVSERLDAVERRSTAALVVAMVAFALALAS